MQILWHGGSTVELNIGKRKLLLNPGAKDETKTANVVVYDKTNAKHPHLEQGLMVDWPGEYDVAGFSFKGFEVQGSSGSNIIYIFQSPDGTLAWMGELGEYPPDDVIESLGEVNVLMVPVGGEKVLSGKDAFKLVEELEPMVVIPICYDDKQGLASFMKEMDVKMPELQKTFEFKRSSINTEGMELVILDA